MDVSKIKYTVSWTQHPQDWNIPNTIKMLENVRRKALEHQHKKLEESSLKETINLLERIRKMK